MDSRIAKENVEDIVGLNGMQRGMLFHYLMTPDESIYNVQLVLGIEGRIDERRFEAAALKVQSENEALRSVFHWERSEQPLGVILKNAQLSFEVRDLSDFDEASAMLMEEQLILEARNARFVLTEVPVRILLIKLSGLRWTLVLTHHHILYDGWSTALFVKALFVAYNGTNLSVSRKALYRDLYKSWRQRVEDPAGEAFWKDCLQGRMHMPSLADAGIPVRTGELSFERAQAGPSAEINRTVRRTLPGTLVEKYSQEHSVTKAAVVYAAFAVLLHKYLLVDQVVFGITVSCREGVEGYEGVMGNWINTVPLAVTIKKDGSLSDLIGEIAGLLPDISRHGVFSYFDIRQLTGTNVQQELFDTMVAIENYPVDEDVLPDNAEYSVRLKDTYEHTSLPLALYVFFKEDLELSFVYKTARFSGDRVEGLMDAFVTILQQLDTKVIAELRLTTKEALREIFWRELSSQPVKPLDLPLDRSRPAVLSYEAGVVELFLPEGLVSVLRSYAAVKKTAIPVVLLAVFHVLLRKYCRHDEIVTGMPVEGDDAIDFLVIRSFVEGAVSFDELVGRIGAAYRDGMAYGAMSVEGLRKALNIENDRSRNAVFDVMFSYDTHGVEIGGYDLNLSLTYSGDGIGGRLIYNRLLLEEATIGALVLHYQTLMGNLLSASSAPVSEMELVSDEQREQLLHLLDNSRVSYPDSSTILDLFREQVKARDSAIAVCLGARTLSYRELDRLSDRVAVALSKRGVGPDVIVGLLTDRTIEMLVCMFGILKAGGAYLPIDVDYPADRIQYLVGDSGTRIVLATGEAAAMVFPGVEVLEIEAALEEEGVLQHAAIGPSNLCYVIYTSGTTGNPKGVMVEHKNVVRLLFNDEFQYDFSAADVWTMFHSHCFDVSVWEIYGALLRGGRIIIIPKRAAREPMAYWNILLSEGVTVLNQTPSAFYSLMAYDLEREERLAVRFVVFAGEALSPGRLAAWHQKYPLVKLVNMYGITETTVHSTYKEVGLEEIRRNLSNVGRPLPTLSIYLLDEYRKVVPRGVIGELYVGGDGVTRGYLHKPGLTEKVFLSDPYRVTERVYKSGDLARILPNGELEYIGRIDHQIQLRGFRIELGEIASHLGKHPKIKEAVVLDKGEDENKFLVAYYLSDEMPDAKELRQYLSVLLPEYMIPSFFVRLDKMPLTSNGKLDRRALPVPQVAAGSVHLSAVNETEAALVGIWADLLKLPKEAISTDRSFFELGGHSLNAAVLVNRIAKIFQLRIPLQEIFRRQDIRGLSDYIGGQKKETFIPLTPAGELASYPVTSAQKRLFFLYELEPDSLAYNMPYCLSVSGALDIQRLEGAFCRLIERHGILRTAFKVLDGQLVQEIREGVEFKMEVLADGPVDELVRSFVRPFDLAEPPLVRLGVSQVSGGEWLVLIDVHHIVSDGVSQRLMVDDLLAFYEGRDLPVLPLQYKDYALWQQSKAQREWVEKQERFWLDKFSGDIPVLSLPLDRPRAAVRSEAGAILECRFSAEESLRIRALTRREGCTLFMTLLAGYYILLSRHSNQEEIVIGVPVWGRRHPDLEDMVGVFINLLALKGQVLPEQRLSDFLSGLRADTLAVMEHQDYPYEQLVERLGVGRDTSRNPLFDALFFFQNFDDKDLELPGTVVRSYPYRHPAAKADLTLLAFEKGEDICLQFEYATALFDGTTIGRLAQELKHVVLDMADGGNKLIGDLELLSEEEKEQIVDQLNQTWGSYPREETIVSILEAVVDQRPDAIALVFEQERMTYRQLDEEASRLARQLREEYKIVEGDLVAVMMPRSERLVVGLLAVMKAGAGYVPVDPAYPAERIAYMLQDSGARLLLTDGEGEEKAGVIRLAFDNPRRKKYSAARLEAGPSAESCCYMIYTSGSTGLPKGVVIRHRNVVNFFYGLDRVLAIEEGEGLLAVTSTAFDISVLELFWTLSRGIVVTVSPSDKELTGLNRYATAAQKNIGFSLSFFSSYKAEEKDKYSLLLRSTGFADAAGFEAVWIPERHFHEFGGLFPNPSVLGAALAAVTKNIAIRAGSVVAPLHDSLRIAEEWSVVDNLSGGRVGISFASGWQPDDFILSTSDFSQRHEKMYNQMAEVMALWRGEKVSRKNGIGKEISVGVFPRPVQRALPVWVTSAGSPDTFRNAGERGANVLTHFLGQDIGMLTSNIRIYREARRKAGFDAGKVTLMVHAYVGRSAAETERLVKAPFIHYLRSAAGLARVIFEQAGFKEGELTEELKDQLFENSFRRYYKETSLIGTVESCAVMVGRLKEADVDELGCLVDFGLEPDIVLEALDRLAEVKRYSGNRTSQPVTVLQSTPSYLQALLADRGSGLFLRGLKTLLVGGEALPQALLKKIRESNRELVVYNMYGPTETTIWSCVHRFDGEPEVISIGKPILNTQVYVLDRRLKVVPVGVTGDLYIGGDGVSTGYWKRPELTADKFIPNPFVPGALLYATGDLARWLPGGELVYEGRKDFQIKIHGFRIETGEIENCLRLMEGVTDAVVAARKEEATGQLQLAAYIVGRGLSETAVRSWLGGRLPYYMIPVYVVFLDALPLTANGKLDRKALPEPRHVAVSGYAAPETPEEDLLVSIWTSVIGGRAIGVTDNFFAVGGDSIKSIQIIAKLREAGYTLSVKDIFTTQHIRQLSMRLRTAASTGREGRSGRFELTPIQRWFFDQSFYYPHHYNQSVLLDFSDRLKEDAMLEIFGKLQEHHDMLRAVFTRGAAGGGIASENGRTAGNLAVGVVGGEVAAESEIGDGGFVAAGGVITGEVLAGASVVALEVFEGLSDEQALAVCNRIQGSIQLERGPLMKLALFQRESRSRLLVVIHHLAVDGISWRILFEDIETLYGQWKTGSELRLPAKTDAYMSWAEQLEKYRQTDAYERGRDYWRAVMRQPVVAIPADRVGGLVDAGAAAGGGLAAGGAVVDAGLAAGGGVEADGGVDKQEEYFELDEEVTGLLLTNVHGAYGTRMNDILLAGLLMAIRGVHGKVTAVIDIEGHGREEISPDVNVSRTVGWFTSIFPVLLDARSTDIPTVIKYVKESLRAVPNNGIDYLLYRYMDQAGQGEADMTWKPQLFFNYLGQFDADVAGKSFSADHRNAGHPVAAGEKLLYDWDLLGWASNGRFSMRLVFDRNRYNTSTVQQLMLAYKNSLEAIVKLCNWQKERILTPSDLTYKGLSVSQTDQLQKQYSIEDVSPLAPMQEAILFYSAAYPTSSNYFVQISYKVSGALDIPDMERSFHELTKRYAIFRTVFLYQGFAQPLQLALKNTRLEFRYLESDQAVDYKAADRSRVFDPTSGQLLRLTILHLADGEYEFVWSYHHIIMDGWCLGIILQDLKTIYRSLRRGNALRLPEVVPYAHYLDWLSRKDREEQRRFWRSYLEGYESVAVLPGRGGWIAEDKENEIHSHALFFGRQRAEAVRRLSVKSKVTAGTIIQTAWGILLSKYNNGRDVVFGMVISGRQAEVSDIGSMVGLFMNTIPVRVLYEDGEYAGDLLERRQAEALQAEQNSYIPLAEIEKSSVVGRGLFNHLLVFENFPVGEALEGMRCEGAVGEEYSIREVQMVDRNNHDLYVIIVPGEDTLIRIDYNPGRYDKAMVERLGGHLLHVIDQLSGESDMLLSDISLTTKEEQRVILTEFNNTGTYFPKEETVISLFERQVISSPLAMAVSCGEDQITYEQLNNLSNRVAMRIREKLPQARNQVVGLCFDPSIELIAGMLGVLKTGYAYICLSPQGPVERNRFILSDCAASLLLTDEAHRSDELNAEGPVVVIGSEDRVAETANPENLTAPEDLLYIIYTSGTSGRPKGVEIEHRGIVNMLAYHKKAYGLSPGMRASQAANPIFDASAFEIWPCLTQGACLYIAPAEARLDGDRMRQWLIANKIEIAYTPTVIARHLLHTDWPAGGSALKVLNIAGERLNHIPVKTYPFRVYNLYGPTEDSIWTTSIQLPYEGMEHTYSIGKPIGNKRIYILDANDHVQPVGVPGEICIAGEGLARGYLHSEELNKQKFFVHPGIPETRLYRTGDAGLWLENGNIGFLGRVDAQVKLNGYRIEPSEIEWQLSTYPGLLGAAVVIREKGGIPMLAAYYSSLEKLDEGRIREHLSSRLPAYMLPSFLVRLDQLPLTRNGKVDKAALPDPWAAVEDDIQRAANTLEREMAVVWGEVLSIEPEQIDVTRSFFQMGGHSLQLVALVNKINLHFQVSLSLNDVFERDNVREIADFLVTLGKDPAEAAGDAYTINIAL